MEKAPRHSRTENALVSMKVHAQARRQIALFLFLCSIHLVETCTGVLSFPDCSDASRGDCCICDESGEAAEGYLWRPNDQSDVSCTASCAVLGLSCQSACLEGNSNNRASCSATPSSCSPSECSSVSRSGDAFCLCGEAQATQAEWTTSLAGPEPTTSLVAATTVAGPDPATSRMATTSSPAPLSATTAAGHTTSSSTSITTPAPSPITSPSTSITKPAPSPITSPSTSITTPAPSPITSPSTSITTPAPSPIISPSTSITPAPNPVTSSSPSLPTGTSPQLTTASALAPVTTTSPGHPPVSSTSPDSSTTPEPSTTSPKPTLVETTAPGPPPSTPHMILAQFSADGGDIVVAWSAATSGAGAGGCEGVVEPGAGAGAGGLGEAPVCVWEQPDTLRVVLGRGASLLPGHSLRFVAPDVTALPAGAAAASDALIPPHAVRVTAPAAARVPTLVLSGPAAVGVCDEVVLLAAGPSARALRYEWGCAGACSANVSAALARVRGPEASLPGSLLELDAPTRIWVTATTFLGATTPRLEHQVTARSMVTPIVTIQVPPAPYLASETLFFTAACRFSACSADESALSFRWLLAEEREEGSAAAASTPVLSGSEIALEVPEATLQAGTAYRLTLTTTQGSGLPVTASLSFVTGHSDLVAAIAGGDRRVWVGEQALELDASGSRDPDGAGSLEFEWACTTGPAGPSSARQPCRRASDGTVFAVPAVDVAVLDLSALELRPGEVLELALTVRGAAERVAQASVRLQLAGEPVLGVAIEQRAHAPPERLTWQASVALDPALAPADAPVEYAWSVAGPGLDSARAQAILAGMARAGWDRPQFALVLDAAGRALLQPGVEYRVALAVRAGDARGASELLLRRPLPPSGGACALSTNQTVAALAEDLVVTCEAWSAERLPLQYRVGYAEEGGEGGGEVEWSSLAYTAQHRLRLDQGRYRIVVEVVDAAGGVTASEAMVAEFAPQVAAGASEDEEAAAMEEVFASMERLGSTAQLLQASGSVMKRLNRDAAGGGRGGRGGRRLLASSAAYRMRVRRMLLRNLQGSVETSMTPRSSGAVLSTTEAVASVAGIEELRPGMAQDSMQSLERASALLVQQPSFSEDDLRAALRVCDAVLFASRMEASDYSRDRVTRAAMDALQRVSGAYARLMLESEASLEVRMEHLAVDIRNAPTSSQSLRVETSVAQASGLLDASLRAPVAGAGAIGVVQAQLMSDVWQRTLPWTPVSAGVVAVVVVDDQQRVLPCDQDVCLRVSIPVDLHNRSQWDLDAFRDGLGVRCLRWEPGLFSSEWNSDGCAAVVRTEGAGVGGNLSNTHHGVWCECDAKEGLFRVAFDPPPEIPYFLPFPRSRMEYYSHKTFVIAVAISGGLWSLLTLLASLLIPYYYQKKFVPLFGKAEGLPDLYIQDAVGWSHFDQLMLAEREDVQEQPEDRALSRTGSFQLRRMSQVERDLGIAKPKPASVHPTLTPLRPHGYERPHTGCGELFRFLRSKTRSNAASASHASDSRLMSSHKASVEAALRRAKKEEAWANLHRLQRHREHVRSLQASHGIESHTLVNQEGLFWKMELGQKQALPEGPFALSGWFYETEVVPALSPPITPGDLRAPPTLDTADTADSAAYDGEVVPAVPLEGHSWVPRDAAAAAAAPEVLRGPSNARRSSSEIQTSVVPPLAVRPPVFGRGHLSSDVVLAFPMMSDALDPLEESPAVAASTLMRPRRASFADGGSHKSVGSDTSVVVDAELQDKQAVWGNLQRGLYLKNNGLSRSFHGEELGFA